MTIRSARREDLDTVAALIQACELADLGEHEMTVEELTDDWSLPGLDLGRDAWVAEEDGVVVGYARVWNRENVRAFLDAYVHPRFRGLGIGSRLLTLMEARAAEEGLSLLVNFAAPADAGARRLFESRGYALVRHHIRMRVELTAPPGQPEPRDGIELTTFVHGQDDRAVYETMNEAFAEEPGYIPDSFEAWSQRHLGSSAFDPSLWLVARDGGQVAGAVIAVREVHTGWVQGLGVRPGARRRGLGRALLLASFGAFWERGVRRIALSVDSDNPTDAHRLYERVGMSEAFRIDVYEKRAPLTS